MYNEQVGGPLDGGYNDVLFAGESMSKVNKTNTIVRTYEAVYGINEFWGNIPKNELQDRKRKALDAFHAWNDITGFVAKGTSYEGELESLIEDAVEIGFYGETKEK